MCALRIPIALGLLLVAATAADVGKKHNTSTPEEIVKTCYWHLNSNLVEGDKLGFHYHFYQPSNTKYGPGQWLWDSGAHMIVWTHRNVTNSILDLRTMLHYQQPDGRIPQTIDWLSAPNATSGKYTSGEYNDITQTPVLAYSLRAMYEATHDVELLREFLPPLVKYFDWWADTRDVDGDGLVSIIHGWESGIDASPAYDAAYHNKHAKPTWFDLYPQFGRLVSEYKKRFNWDQKAICSQKEGPKGPYQGFFLVQDTAVNSILASGWGIFSDLAKIAGDEEMSKHCKARQEFAEAAILKLVWNEETGRFASAMYHDGTGARVPATVEAVQTLFPLLLDSIPKDLQERIVRGQVMNENKFFLKYPVPSVSADSPSYQGTFPWIEPLGLMWRGPTWPMMNWFVTEALMKHGYEAEARQIVDRWIDLYKHSGVWEHYNPETGKTFGQEGLGMSTLIVDWLYRLGIVHDPIEF